MDSKFCNQCGASQQESTNASAQARFFASPATYNGPASPYFGNKMGPANPQPQQGNASAPLGICNECKQPIKTGKN